MTPTRRTRRITRERIPGPSTPKSSGTPSISLPARTGFEHWRGARLSRSDPSYRLGHADLFPSHFLDVYGRPNRLMVPERKMDANLSQALTSWRAPLTRAIFPGLEASWTAR